MVSVSRQQRTVLMGALVAVVLIVAAGLVLSGRLRADTQQAQQTVDGLTITLEKATNPQINQSQQFVVRLIDQRGQPVEDASVYLDLDMPAMPMSLNQPIASSLGNGMYQAESVYTMDGFWTVTVVANVDGREHRAVFDSKVAQ